MNSKLFSVLKIVAIAMLLVWAIGGSTQAVAQTCLNAPGYGNCMSGCSQTMTQCENSCHACDNPPSPLPPLPVPGIIFEGCSCQNNCASNFAACQSTCNINFCVIGIAN